MCGIAGCRASTESVEEVGRMLNLIRHRGPDDIGVSPNRPWTVGMVRLAIMDPTHARQPMYSEDGRWTVVLNGEIYNFLAHRSALEAEGKNFATRSDTEVVVALIAKHGFEEALRKIEGMFALAAVDSKSGDLWLARDRFGEKPLYIDRRAGFRFCSELTPLWRSSAMPGEPDAHGVAAILRYGYPWPGRTAVRGISELQPGTWLRRTERGAESTGRYWAVPDRVDESVSSVEKAEFRLIELLSTSVRNRLVADVPLGLFLSGGIDSGAVAALASRERADVEAVTVRFKDGGYDESALAASTARHVGIRLHQIEGDLAAYSAAGFDDLLEHHGQPFADTSAVPTRAVSAAARRRFKVVLSGDGGDELLGGYLGHQRSALFDRFPPIPLLGIPDRLSKSHYSRVERLGHGLRLYRAAKAGELAHEMAGVFSDQMLRNLFCSTTWASAVDEHLEFARRDAARVRRETADPVLALSRFQIRHSLPQDILTKVDRMSMAESLEVRAPMLDSAFASYALSLPAPLKLRRGKGKFVLRYALRNLLPPDVLSAPKRGFAMPVRRWLGDSFWTDLTSEAVRAKAQNRLPINWPEVDRRIAADRATTSRRNDYRALHRGVLLYGLFRWSRLLGGHQGIGRSRP